MHVVCVCNNPCNQKQTDNNKAYGFYAATTTPTCVILTLVELNINHIITICNWSYTVISTLKKIPLSEYLQLINSGPVVYSASTSYLSSNTIPILIVSTAMFSISTSSRKSVSLLLNPTSY